MIFLRGLLLSAAICSLPYLIYSAQFPPVAVTAAALAVASAGFALMDPARKWQSGAGIGIGIVVPILAKIILDTQADPTSHNLAPFEFLMGLAVSMPPAMLGALAGGALARVAQPSTLTGGALASVGLLIAAIHAPMARADIVGTEAAALAKIRSLIAEQREYRSSGPTRAYTCDLSKLSDDFGAPRRYKLSRPVAGVYERGTQVEAGEYAFTLLCSDERPPSRFMISAMPVRLQWGKGRLVYCAETDGPIRVINRKRYNHCLTKGRPVD